MRACGLRGVYVIVGLWFGAWMCLMFCFLFFFFCLLFFFFLFFFFQAEDGIRDLVRSRGLGDVYKRQGDAGRRSQAPTPTNRQLGRPRSSRRCAMAPTRSAPCLLYTSDAADERSSVDLGGRRIIKKKTRKKKSGRRIIKKNNKHSQ